eukprot:EC792458.1.p3 GENE.EC792458.1~~EC792458.1.p3  ORF type:complete len:60 (+),score=13.26 EC792458.1:320-499(+)
MDYDDAQRVVQLLSSTPTPAPAADFTPPPARPDAFPEELMEELMEPGVDILSGDWWPQQ